MHLLKTKASDGYDAWYYILVDREKVQKFREAVSKEGRMKISQYGKILKSGYGKEPPHDITVQMEKEFDFLPESI